MTARRIVPSINEVDNYWHSISKGVLLVGKIIVRVKKGVYDIALLSHVNDNKFNNMSLFDVRRFSANKETYLIIFLSFGPVSKVPTLTHYGMV